MIEQPFDVVVGESRVFYRRRLAERLAIAQMRTTGGVDSDQIVTRAAEITAALEVLETPDEIEKMR